MLRYYFVDIGDLFLSCIILQAEHILYRTKSQPKFFNADGITGQEYEGNTKLFREAPLTATWSLLTMLKQRLVRIEKRLESGETESRRREMASEASDIYSMLTQLYFTACRSFCNGLRGSRG